MLKFAGFTARVRRRPRRDAGAAGEERTTCKKPLLPQLTRATSARLQGIEPKQHFTEPPPRYTEASLVRALEENGIGRPSTYQLDRRDDPGARLRTQQIERRFQPTEIGMPVNDLLVEHFKDIVDLGFTAADGSATSTASPRAGERLGRACCARSTARSSASSSAAEKKLPKFEAARRADRRDLPDLRPADGHQDRPLRQVHLVHADIPSARRRSRSSKTPARICPKDGGKVVERKSRKGRTFYGCANYPKCDFVSWDRVVPEPCPVCGSYVVAKTQRGGVIAARVRGRPRRTTRRRWPARRRPKKPERRAV